DTDAAVSHRRQRLHAAEIVDRVRTGAVKSVQRVAVHPLRTTWRRAADDVADPRHRGGANAHHRAGHERVLAARHVAPNPPERNVLVAEGDPLLVLDLEVEHGLALA